MANSRRAWPVVVGFFQNTTFVPSCGRRSSGFDPKVPGTACGRVVGLHGCFCNMLLAEIDEPCQWLDKHRARESKKPTSLEAFRLAFRQASTVIVKPEGRSQGLPASPSRARALRGLCLSYRRRASSWCEMQPAFG